MNAALWAFCFDDHMRKTVGTDFGNLLVDIILDLDDKMAVITPILYSTTYNREEISRYNVMQILDPQCWKSSKAW